MTGRGQPPTLTVPALLEARAEADGDRLAIRVAGAGALTFREWHHRSCRVACRLLDRGIGAGRRVGLIFDGTCWTDYAVAYCGVQRAGAVPVAISPASTAPEIDQMLTSCSASLVVSGAPGPPVRCVPRADFADLDHGDAGPVSVRAKPGDLAQIIYTSGTSGRPKGVGASHANVTHGCRLAPRYRLFGHSEHFVHAFPVATNAAHRMLLNAIVAHPSAVALARFDAEELCGVIAQLSAGTVFIVPAMAIDLANSQAFERYDLSCVVVVASSGSVLPQPVALSLARIFPNATILNSYTSTEAMPAQVTLMIDPSEPASAGFPAAPGDIRIADDAGVPLPAGTTGAVWLRCPAPPRFYFGTVQESAQTFRDGWIRMGDVGYLDDAGRLFLVDRESDVLQSGALKISSAEIESVLLEHPQVREAAVFGVPHPVMGSLPAAAVVLGCEDSLPAVRSFLRERLAPSKVPVRWLTVRELPRNQMGKVVKAELRERLAAARSRAARA